MTSPDRKKRRNLTFAFFSIAPLLFATAHSAFAGELGQGTYRLRNVPPQQGISCEEYALQLGQQLRDYLSGSIAGFEVVETRCFEDATTVPQTKGVWNVEITYNGDGKLNRVSTNDSGVTMFQPSFTDKESCEAGLAAETPVFERQTGVRVFIAYCAAPRYSSDGWQAAIEGFGTPKNRPYSDSLPIFGKVLGHNWDTFKQTLSAGLAKFGFEFAQAELSNKLAYSELLFRYYGDHSLTPHSHEIASLPSKEICLAEVTRVQAAVDRDGIKTLGVFCWEDRIQGFARLDVVTDGENALRFAHPEESFETFEACEAVRDSIADTYRTRYKHQVIAGVCNYDWKAKVFHVNLIEKPRQ